LDRKRPLTEEELLKALDDSDANVFDDDDSVIDEDFKPNHSDLDSSEEEDHFSDHSHQVEDNEEEDEEDGNTQGTEEILNEKEIEDLEEEASTNSKPKPTSGSGPSVKSKIPSAKGKRKMQSKRPQLKWGNWNLEPDFPDYEPDNNYDVGERGRWSPIDYFSNYYNDEFFVLLASAVFYNLFEYATPF
jgi:hypothetical protein